MLKDYKEIDLINLDVEGIDTEILFDIDLEKYFPKVILFEDNLTFGGSKKIREHLEKFGYERLFVSGGSVAYFKTKLVIPFNRVN